MDKGSYGLNGQSEQEKLELMRKHGETMPNNGLSALFVDVPKPVTTEELVKQICKYTGDTESFKLDFTDMIITQNLAFARLSKVDICKCAPRPDDIEFHFNCYDDKGYIGFIFIMSDDEFERLPIIGSYLLEAINKLDKQDRVELL